MWILGINGPPVGWHDAAACLVDGDGTVWAMAEEERFTRVKHAPGTFPVNAARFCLEHAGIEPADLDVVAIGWDLPRGFSKLGGSWDFTSPGQLFGSMGWSFEGRGGPELICVPHHRAHAASAFYASGLERAAVLVNDGAGDHESISIYEAGFGAPLVQREVWPRSHSLGCMYDAVCRSIGLSFFEAGKTMGLASYGRARSIEPWPLMKEQGIDFRPVFGASPKAEYDEVLAAWERRIARFVPSPVTTPSAGLDTDEVAIRLAWSAQATVEAVVPALAAHARAITGIEELCLAGGVALNCSANGLLEGPTHATPVSHDAGVALGAAWAISPPPAPQEPLSPYLGSEIETPSSAPEGWAATELDPDAVADRLLRGQVGAVAWGRAEVGPRALGHRSIIALPQTVEMRDRVNTLKGRELWRPLAPIGTPETASALWHGPSELHRYMLGAAEVTPLGCERIAATVHIDGTARAQVAEDAGLLSAVLDALAGAGADPVLINTSFNARGEPIVDSADDALRAAEKIGVDFLVAGEALLDRR